MATSSLREKEPYPTFNGDEGLFIRQIRDFIIRNSAARVRNLIRALYSAKFGYPSVSTLIRWTGLPKEVIIESINVNEDKQAKRVQFTTTNEPKMKKTFNAKYSNDVWQIDLVDLKSIFSNLIDPDEGSASSGWEQAMRRIFPIGYPPRYCLVVLDTYSRKVFVETTVAKGADYVLDAMLKIMGTKTKASQLKDTPQIKPNVIYCDYGGEFKGVFWRVLGEYISPTGRVRGLGIKFFHPKNIFTAEAKYLNKPIHDPVDIKYEGHAAMVERVNRTLKGIVFKMLNGEDLSTIRSKTVSGFMKHVANIYNNRIHSAIGMTPNQKYNNDLIDVRRHRAEYYFPKPIRLPKFKVGDYVYLKYQSKLFEKGYIERFDSGVMYQIVSVNPRINKDNKMFFTYTIVINEEGTQFADFYEEMLTK